MSIYLRMYKEMITCHPRRRVANMPNKPWKKTWIYNGCKSLLERPEGKLDLVLPWNWIRSLPYFTEEFAVFREARRTNWLQPIWNCQYFAFVLEDIGIRKPTAGLPWRRCRLTSFTKIFSFGPCPQLEGTQSSRHILDLIAIMPTSKEAATSTLLQIVRAHPLLVFGRSTERSFKDIESVLMELGAEPTLIELQNRTDGCVLEDVIYQQTGNAPPTVFVHGSAQQSTANL